ncbi:WD repeat-containing protein [Reticulomyxa filosa]|uniref:WD repeat-containing protein n=1 Tax=Reticulomyxa filosa TaxID=46433 RepID=X6MU76_RETFI|nr:WD repeat-containing protein [Reticulomyxa filosa]|eukprot:ETO16987.1 WD repeat-containing protein [Reticulomyxa filosa]
MLTEIYASAKFKNFNIVAIVQNWIRTSNIKFGWIDEFDKIVAKYVKRKQIFIGHYNSISGAKFSPDGNTIVLYHQDIIRLYDIKSGRELMKLDKHFFHVSDTDFSPDGKHIASCSGDCTIRIWNVSNGEEIQVLQHSGGVNSVQYSPDGQIIVSSSSEIIYLWNVKSGEIIKKIKEYNIILQVHFSPDGRSLVSCSNRAIRIWNVESGREKILNGHTERVNDAKYFPDGRTIASCSIDKTIRLWDVKTGYEVQKLEKANYGNYINVSSNGRMIVSSWGSIVLIWG